MNWPCLVLAAVTVATPVPLRKLEPLHAALPPGASAVISAAGNNVPCWDSPAALSAFTNAFRANDRPAMALDIANDAILLEEGTRVRALGVQGALGGVIRLKLVDGSHAGAICYEQSVLRIYAHVKAAKKPRTPSRRQ